MEPILKLAEILLVCSSLLIVNFGFIQQFNMTSRPSMLSDWLKFQILSSNKTTFE